MNRDALVKLLDVIIVPGNVIGDIIYLEQLNNTLGLPYSGEPITALSARQIILKAFDEGLLA